MTIPAYWREMSPSEQTRALDRSLARVAANVERLARHVGVPVPTATEVDAAMWQHDPDPGGTLTP
ncbi:hypothetical protein LQ327_20185 [Actinomycetospora endophytica]|uniref:Uncharacterized protein n=1 Tax=Actinomycetospora endophytica TaxID=2291215 RepID=A0ABS8PBU5_9PSEU|nr:hypothetical protein [Actinomycetospora endophytica]MCD2195693.1 hypothetical protein [Actinomycetospora endophytica]